MGTTPTYGIPYPEKEDPPRGSDQMEALASATDTALSNAVSGMSQSAEDMHDQVTGELQRHEDSTSGVHGIPDTASLAVKEDLAPLATRDELAPLASKEELIPLAAKADLEPLARRTELSTLATKEEISGLATSGAVTSVDKKITDHESLHANVHGIADVDALETKEGAQVKADGAHMAAVSTAKHDAQEMLATARGEILTSAEQDARKMTDAVRVEVEEEASRVAEEKAEQARAAAVETASEHTDSKVHDALVEASHEAATAAETARAAAVAAAAKDAKTRADSARSGAVSDAKKQIDQVKSEAAKDAAAQANAARKEAVQDVSKLYLPLSGGVVSGNLRTSGSVSVGGAEETVIAGKSGYLALEEVKGLLTGPPKQGLLAFSEKGKLNIAESNGERVVVSPSKDEGNQLHTGSDQALYVPAPPTPPQYAEVPYGVFSALHPGQTLDLKYLEEMAPNLVRTNVPDIVATANGGEWGKSWRVTLKGPGVWQIIAQVHFYPKDSNASGRMWFWVRGNFTVETSGLWPVGSGSGLETALSSVYVAVSEDETFSFAPSVQLGEGWTGDKHIVIRDMHMTCMRLSGS